MKKVTLKKTIIVRYVAKNKTITDKIFSYKSDSKIKDNLFIEVFIFFLPVLAATMMEKQYSHWKLYVEMVI